MPQQVPSSAGWLLSALFGSLYTASLYPITTFRHRLCIELVNPFRVPLHLVQCGAPLSHAWRTAL